MKSRIALILAGVTACLPAALIAGNTWETSGYEGGGPPALEEYAKSQKALYDGLTMDFDKVTEATTVTYVPTEADLEFLKDKTCPTCVSGESLIRVGVNGSIGKTFDFSALPGRVGLKPIDFNGGVLRALPSGELVWTVGVSSPGAYGMRVGFTDFNLPDGVGMTLYNWNEEAYGPYLAQGPNEDGVFWSNSISGSDVFLEIRAASLAALAGTSFVLNEVAHLDSTLFPGVDKKCDGVTEACMVDATCFGVADFAPIVNARKAMGQMLFSVSGGQALCSGGLLADVSQSKTPYFLTANHCLSTQATASSLQVTWRYQTPSCDAACPDYSESRFPKTLGARLLATGATPAVTDFTLLRLTGVVPSDAFYLGWTRANVQSTAGTKLFRLSHPAGAPLHFTRYNVTPDGYCDDFAPRSRFIYGVPDIGAAEGGSSGSPLMTSTGLVVGQLLGACGVGVSTPCQDVTGYRTVDGAFRVTYDRIKDFIDPAEPIDLPFASQYYMAEGVTGPAFDTYVLLSNPGSEAITVELTFLAQNEENKVAQYSIPAYRRQTVLVDDFIANDGVSISAREVNGKSFVAERAIYSLDASGNWVGAHSSVGATTPSNTWYFPEGSTVEVAGPGTNFETYLLVANPNDQALPLTFTFFLQDGTSFTKTFVAPAKRRLTVAPGPGLDSRLANTSFFTRISSPNLTFYAERAMWWRNPQSGFGGFVEGNNSLGIPELSTNWYFAEGNNLPGTDEFVLLANPGNTDAVVTLDYLLQGTAAITKSVTVPANSRQTVNVGFDAVTGLGDQTTKIRHGLAVTSTAPIAAERSMYFTSNGVTWLSGHNTVGSPRTANVWALPEGASFDNLRSDIAIANPNISTVAVEVIYLLESGSEVRRNYNIAGRQRLTLHGTDESAVRGKAYSTLVLSTGGNVVAERSSQIAALGSVTGAATCSMGISLNANLTTTLAKEELIDSLRGLAPVSEEVTVPTPTVTPTVTPTPAVP
ncbi:hypothetical protein GC173_11945 [bacterium]|nr:hypothetical protein [bacterium]